MKFYEHRDVQKIFPDLNTRTLISWSEKGLLRPVIDAGGSGIRRQYSVRNLVEIGVIRELFSYRVQHEFISAIMKKLSKKRLSPKDEFDVVVAGSKSHVSYGKRGPSYVFDVRLGSRSGFKNEAAWLVYGEKLKMESSRTQTFTRIPGVASTVIVSLADIYEAIKNQL